MAPKIVCVAGPTACGKTKLGVLLAQRFNGEVVSADSMQIYKGMTIGTAAPTVEEMDGVPHHMIAIAEPDEQWSAAKYAQTAIPIVDDILARGKLPIIVGGTGLWVDALVQGRQFAGGCAGEKSVRSWMPGWRRRASSPCWRSCGRWTPRPRNVCTPRTRSASSGHWRSTGRPARPSRSTTKKRKRCPPVRRCVGGAAVRGPGGHEGPHRPAGGQDGGGRPFG